MAYLRDYEPKRCDARGCFRRAARELIDRWNGSRGYYCEKHAGPALQERQRGERGEDGYSSIDRFATTTEDGRTP
jgi:hypothetical protein